MKKLRTLLAAALITLPVLALDAAVTVEPTKPQVSSTQALDSCCWILLFGRWWCIPCV
jgi:hypothetical protein